MEEVNDLGENIKKTIDGYKNEGFRYLQKCPNQALKDISWCCNRFLHHKFGIDNELNTELI